MDIALAGHIAPHRARIGHYKYSIRVLPVYEVIYCYGLWVYRCTESEVSLDIAYGRNEVMWV